MSTRTQPTIKTSSSRTDPARGAIPSLPRQRSNEPTRRQRQSRISLAIVTLLAGGVGVAALWMGIGSEDAVEAPPRVPPQVVQNTDSSANAIEHDLLRLKLGQTTDSSTNALERDLLRQKLGQSPASVDGSGQAQTGGQSSANAVEHGMPTGLSAEEWTQAMKGLNSRARAEAFNAQ